MCTFEDFELNCGWVGGRGGQVKSPKLFVKINMAYLCIPPKSKPNKIVYFSFLFRLTLP